MTRSRATAKKAGTPCKGCGGPKPPGQGKRYCDPCRDRTKPMIQREQYVRRNERARAARREGRQTTRVMASDAPPGQKWCARCVQYLPVEEFGMRGSKRAAYCRPCASAYMHERALARGFGITPEEYEQLLALQEGRCAICERKPRTRRLAVDHDHETGEIRGLLCTRCNHKLIGAAHESSAMLRRAAHYLERPPAQTGLPVPAPLDDLAELRIAEWSALRDEGAADTPDVLHLDGYVVMSGDAFLRLIQETE